MEWDEVGWDGVWGVDSNKACTCLVTETITLVFFSNVICNKFC